MARILMTSGPTREYLDPVRFLSNASSGRMGQALAEAAIEAGHQVIIVSGPVDVEYPPEAEVVPVMTTQDMLEACLENFPACDGLIGVAAPCDYRATQVEPHKIRKTGQPLVLELIETVDIMAELAKQDRQKWLVGFALETEDAHFRAMTKLQQKNCDLIVLNGPEAMHAKETQIEVLDRTGQTVLRLASTKKRAATAIMELVVERLIRPQA